MNYELYRGCLHDKFYKFTLAGKFVIVVFFSGVGGIELGFEPTKKFDKYARQIYQLNSPETYLDGRIFTQYS